MRRQEDRVEQDFILGVIGNFSGRAPRKPERFLDVDRDDFGEIFERLKPLVALDLPFCDGIRLADWDDWHPDGLAEKVPALAKLLEARECAGDAARMRGRLAEAGVSLEAAERPPASDTAPTGEARASAPASNSDLLDDLLGGAGNAGGRPAARHVADPEFAALVAEIVAPHAEKIDHAGIAARRAAIDRELGARTRSLLRHPAFRARESLWRSLRGLVWGSETGEGLGIRMLDADVDALHGEEGADLRGALQRLIVTDEAGTLGGRPFGLLLFDLEVEAREEDLALLEGVGRIAAEARVPCLLGAGRSLWQAEHADAAAAFLAKARSVPGADRIGLCAPRLLLRLPYGRSGEPVERFAFEEVDADTGDEGFLWGGGGFAVAAAAAEAVAEARDPAQIARFVRRDGLPFHPRGRDADPAGPTEQVLSDKELARLRDLGLLPIAGARGQDVAVVRYLVTLTGAPLLG
jgi:type VI secretion system protein ImpC